MIRIKIIGTFEILMDDEENLSLKYGVWGGGFLEENEENSFQIHFNTDIVQEFYSGGLPGQPPMYLKFHDDLAFNFCYLHNFDGQIFEYERGKTIDILPPQLWDDDCFKNQATSIKINIFQFNFLILIFISICYIKLYM